MSQSLKLYSFDIKGTPVAYMDSYNNQDLSGNTAFIISSANTDSNYTDVTSDAISIVKRHGDSICSNYQHKQRLIKLFHYEKGWVNLTHEETDIVIDYYANPEINPTGDTQNTQIITHLMVSHGMGLDEAKSHMVDKWHDHWMKFIDDCPDVWKQAVKVSVKYLSFVDASDLLNTIENLVSYFLDSGRLGIGYGDNKDGVLNYIKSTSGFVGTGLESNAYILNGGTWEDFICELEDVFVGKVVWDRIDYLIQSM